MKTSDKIVEIKVGRPRSKVVAIDKDFNVIAEGMTLESVSKKINRRHLPLNNYSFLFLKK